MTDDELEPVILPKSFYAKALKANDGFGRHKITKVDGADNFSKVLG